VVCVPSYPQLACRPVLCLRHSHTSADFPATDKGCWAQASSGRTADRIILDHPRYLSNVKLQGFARCPSLHNVARYFWLDHDCLAHCPGRGWRRKRLVQRRCLWGHSESQTVVEVSQAVRLHSIDLPPDYCSPRRRLVSMGLGTQRLRRPACCIHSGARSHHRIPLFSRQAIEDEVFLSCGVHKCFFLSIVRTLCPLVRCMTRPSVV